MADLPAALDAALRGRYRVQEVKSPASTRRGLSARMNQLEKTFTRKGERAGTGTRRAAAAAGVSPRTWQRWRAGTQTPGPKLLAKLESAYARLVTLPAFRRSVNTGRPPNRVKVTAEIMWTTSPRKAYNKTKHRSTTLEGMSGVMVSVIRAWATAGPEAAADALERGTATVYGANEIRFEGDHVEIEFP